MIMNLTEKLLACDPNKILEKKKGTIEIPRLTALLGEPFILTLKAIPARRYSEIQTNTMDMDEDGVPQVDLYNLQMLSMTESIESPDLSSNKMMQHFKVETPSELYDKLFLPGEMNEIAAKINEISGYKKKTRKNRKKQIDKIKN